MISGTSLRGYWGLWPLAVSWTSTSRAPGELDFIPTNAWRLLEHQPNNLWHTSRLRRRAANSIEYPTKPSNRFLEIWATFTAILREVRSPQLYISVRWLSWATPPPLGRIIALLIYWAIVIYMATAGAIVDDALYWERIGYRNAWTTMMQLPLLYLLSTKCNIVGLIAGVGHERLNWLHRWVARTMFVTASVHGWHFYTMWDRADFVEIQMEMMPMVKYGIGAWALLLWSIITSFAPVRRLSYEVFILQHIITAVLFLWLIYVHVPKVARYYLWFAIAALCFDRFCRTVLLIWQNIKFFPNKSRCKGGQRIGHQAQVRAVGSSITVVTIKDVHFKWRAGQHLYLWMPRVGPMEAHPYTIACAHRLPETCICNSIQLVVRKHNGFSRRLYDFAAKAQAEGRGRDNRLTVFVSGPYGVPPRWDIYETIVLISASTGASFTMPILESVLLHANRKTNCTKRIDFLLTAKQGEEIGFYVDRLHEFIDQAKSIGIEILVHVAVTNDPATPQITSGFALKDEGSSTDIRPMGSSGSESAPPDSCCNTGKAGPSAGCCTTEHAAPAAATCCGAEEAVPAQGSCCGTTEAKPVQATCCSTADKAPAQQIASCCSDGDKAPISSSEVTEKLRPIVSGVDVEKDALSDSRSVSRQRRRTRRGSNVSTDSHVHHATVRPDIAAFVRRAVEATGGETSVVICGGPSLVSRVRNCVASLSDERAVHKGSGAQGIHIYAEEYSF